MAKYREEDIIGYKSRHDGSGVFPIIREGAVPIDEETKKQEQIAKNQEEAERSAEAEKPIPKVYTEFENSVKEFEKSFNSIQHNSNGAKQRKALRELRSKLNELRMRIDYQNQRFNGLAGVEEDQKLLSGYLHRIDSMLVSIENHLDASLPSDEHNYKSWMGRRM